MLVPGTYHFKGGMKVNWGKGLGRETREMELAGKCGETNGLGLVLFIKAKRTRRQGSVGCPGL